MTPEISWPLRVAVALWVVALVCSSQSGPVSNKYPLEVYQMYQQRLVGSGKATLVGSWSHWSHWSRCSRSCGGGVTVQSRECRYKEPRSDGRGKRRRTRAAPMDTNSTLSPGDNKLPKSQCVGVYKRFHMCNDQTCPGPAKDFRQLQCEQFNGKQFMGRAYLWEPFLDAPNTCELNCRAVGQRFYATLNQSVVDGTPCKGASSNSRWVCVSGLCKHVGCDGVVGSAKRLDACGVCGGANNTCRLVSGLFTMPRLPDGYSLIAQLPRGACNITVAEMQPSSNYLALRRLSGQYILNGNFAINWSGDYEGAGTLFTFRRQEAGAGEVITAPGPLLEPVDIMLLYQQPNPGIKYEYMLPMKSDGSTPPIPRPASSIGNSVISPPYVLPGAKPGPDEQTAKETPVQDWPHNRSPVFPYGSGVLGTDSQAGRSPPQDELHKPPAKSRGRKRKFGWKLAGFSECSKTCGGGMSASITVCVRESSQMTVPDKRCSHSEKPHPQLMRCNTKPCPAEWVPAEWGECSVTCGEGVQTREMLCKQEITASLTMKVADGACIGPSTHPRSQPCHRPPCPGSENRARQPSQAARGKWQASDWSQCSMACGKGTRSRAVKCAGADGSEQDDCALADRPAQEEQCNLGPCPDASKHSPWMFTEWTQQCSGECGTGVQTRRVHCSGDACDRDSVPDDSRACSSDKQCSGKWFSGPWGSCSPTCGLGQQTRDVVCVAFIRGQHRVALDMNCPVTLKPATERVCESAPCSPEWFFTDWTQCSRECGTGVQKRDVRCLDEKRQSSTGCSEDTRPPGRRVCNTHDCSGGDKVPSSLHARADDDPTVINGAGDQALPDDAVSKDCVDVYPNCHLVVQARLCKYKYYRTYCCHSCHKKS